MRNINDGMNGACSRLQTFGLYIIYSFQEIKLNCHTAYYQRVLEVVFLIAKTNVLYF